MPIASPTRNLRMSALITLARTGDAGCSSNAEKAQAEIMNVPRQMASIMYSGQCAVIARLASSAQHPVLKLAATGSSSSCAAKTFTAMAGVHWVSLLMRGGIRDLGKGFTAEKQNHTLGLCSAAARYNLWVCQQNVNKTPVLVIAFAIARKTAKILQSFRFSGLLLQG